MDDLKNRLSEAKKTLDNISQKLNLADKSSKLQELTAKSMKGDFWQDLNSATKTMEQISNLKEEIDGIKNLKVRIQDALGIINVSKENDETIAEELQKEVESIENQIKELELHLFLSGKYDHSSAILSVHAGQGGTEAMDWAQMLLRMYLRFSEMRNWKSAILSENKGEEAGIKSVDVEVSGAYAYGYLKNEAGTHRLVRKSPFNADNLRQTSFALVEVLPVIEDVKEVEISPEDLEFETFRSSGPGGQNVQKVETAVRVRHKPSGIVVSTQSERSQSQNKENALKLLRSKLFKLEEEEKEKEEKKLKGEYKTASWGNQIRNYVLHPYKMVKDLRTGVETSDPQAVLDGELDRFIEAELKLETKG